MVKVHVTLKLKWYYNTFPIVENLENSNPNNQKPEDVGSILHLCLTLVPLHQDCQYPRKGYAIVLAPRTVCRAYSLFNLNGHIVWAWRNSLLPNAQMWKVFIMARKYSWFSISISKYFNQNMLIWMLKIKKQKTSGN